MGGSSVGRYCQGKTELLEEQPVTVPLSPPQMSNGLARDRNWEPPINGRLNMKHTEMFSPYRAENTPSVIKTSQLMLYREIMAVCSQIHTKHKYTVWRGT